MRTWLLRLPLVLIAGALAGAAAWFVTTDDRSVYERTLTFVIRPSATLSDAQIPDAVRGLSQQDAQLVNTIGGVIGSDRFLSGALQRVGVDEADGYSARSSRRPGSDIVEIALRGPDREALAAVADEYRDLVIDWVGRTYGAYELEYLAVDVSAGAVAPATAQVVGIATLLGLLLASALVFAEWNARTRRRRDTSSEAATRGRAVLIVEDSVARLNRLEVLLDAYLDVDEAADLDSRRVARAAAAEGTRSTEPTQR